MVERTAATGWYVWARGGVPLQRIDGVSDKETLGIHRARGDH